MPPISQMTSSDGAILELGLVLLAAAGAGLLARRVGLPAVLGYLVVGFAISPFTPGYIADREQIQLLADVGVVLLLFEVGIEIDLVRLGTEQRGLLVAVPVQVATTMAAGTAAGLALGLPLAGAAIVGLSIALSSSVVIVNITRSRRRTTDRPTERALLGWGVVQDVLGVTIAVVLLAAVDPGARPPPLALVAFVAFGALALVSAKVVPAVLRHLRSEHDLFLVVSVASGLAIAGLGAVAFGLPLALAAFVAGLAIGEGAETAEARRRLLPFRDLLAVLFFVAIGMLIDPSALGAGLPALGLFAVVIVLAKVVPAWALVRATALPARPLQLAIGLGQVGEFSFVLVQAGSAAGAIPSDVHAAMLAAIAVSIAVSTVGVRRVRTPAAPTEAGSEALPSLG